MFDDLIDIFTFRNMFIPLISFFQDLFYGSSTHFGVSSLAGFSKRDVRRILNNRGVQLWGDMYDGDMLYFTVRQSQAKLSHQVLSEAGVPILFPKLEDR